MGSKLRYGISSWSVHRLLGEPRYELADSAGDTLLLRSGGGGGGGEASLSLLDLPAAAAAHGLATLEIVHFHLPSLERAYLADLREAVREAGVELYSVLIDTGDLTHPDPAQRRRDVAVIGRWIEAAAALGAGHVRIDAGLQPPHEEVIELSVAGLRELADVAASLGVGVITENWHATSREPGPLLTILERCEGRVGLCVDFGNAAGPGKYETLAMLMPRATSIHLKAERDEAGRVDEEDLRRAMAPIHRCRFEGPVSLIHGETREDWAGILDLRQRATAALHHSAA